MAEKNNFNAYFTHEKWSPDNAYRDRVPNGFSPIGEIELHGRAARSFASGRMPGWIIITGWILFAPYALIFIYVAIKAILEGYLLDVIISGAIGFIILSILWRGTKGKLNRNKRKRRQKRSR